MTLFNSCGTTNPGPRTIVPSRIKKLRQHRAINYTEPWGMTTLRRAPTTALTYMHTQISSRGCLSLNAINACPSPSHLLSIVFRSSQLVILSREDEHSGFGRVRSGASCVQSEKEPSSDHYLMPYLDRTIVTRWLRHNFNVGSPSRLPAKTTTCPNWFLLPT
jgi:hypothetical protein